MSNFLTLIKNKVVINAIIMALFYQVIFIGIFMYGYSAIPKNMTDLTIAIVNDDTQYGKEITKNLQKQLPFEIEIQTSLTDAKKELNDRKIHMIIHIPKDFSKNLAQQSEKVQLDFLINQSNPAMVPTAMQEVSTQVTNILNDQFAIQNAQGLFQELQMEEEKAKELSSQLTHKLDANVINTVEVSAGMHHQMAPFFLTMVSYIGAMIYSLMTVGVTSALKYKLGVWKTFASLQAINILLALFAPIVGLIVYFSIAGGFSTDIFVKMWLVHALEMFGAIQFMSIFCIWVGSKAQYFNIPLMIAQTISSGAVMTQSMMPDIFRYLSHISLMFYSVQLDFSIMFGGGKIGENLIGLFLVSIASFVIATIVYKLKSSNSPTTIQSGGNASANVIV